MTNITVLVSGGGTNLQAVIDAISSGKIPDARIALVISSRADAFALTRAARAGIKTAVVPREDFPEAAARGEAMLRLIAEAQTHLVLTLGYMSILDAHFVKACAGRILNIHPSLLPRHGGVGYYGLRVHEAVLAAGDAESGATVHYVTEEVDGGRILIQRSVPVLATDDAKSLAGRVLEVEHEILIEGIQKHLADRKDDIVIKSNGGQL
jgi:phosphoribosylglycinamide formyltransferase-1